MAASRDDDLALARRCAEGDEQAWERFVREYRPILYRAADALDPGGGARDLADGLYADLYGTASSGARSSLFRYYQGRSSLATWLRAVLAQRYVDRIRAARRLDPLPDDDRDPPARHALQSAGTEPPDVDAIRCGDRVRVALTAAIASLDPRERLRLGWYYVQNLTLARIGKLLGEHEATVSRQLARIRGSLRTAVERDLAGQGLSAEQVSRCVELAAGDAGTLDLEQVLGSDPWRKEPVLDRSKSGEA